MNESPSIEFPLCLREAGIDIVLQKPFSIGKLGSVVRKVVFDARAAGIRQRLAALPSAA